LPIKNPSINPPKVSEQPAKPAPKHKPDQTQAHNPADETKATLGDMTVTEVKKFVEEIHNIGTLEGLLDEEMQTASRKGAVEAIEARIEKLEAE
jgi:hypothetical protein